MLVSQNIMCRMSMFFCPFFPIILSLLHSPLCVFRVCVRYNWSASSIFVSLYRSCYCFVIAPFTLADAFVVNGKQQCDYMGRHRDKTLVRSFDFDQYTHIVAFPASVSPRLLWAIFNPYGGFFFCSLASIVHYTRRSCRVALC